MMLERGMALGYRKSREGGSWIVRRHETQTDMQGNRVSRHTERRVGSADDSRDADGSEVLTFSQAQRRVLAEATLEARRASGQLYTVADAVADYLEYQRTHRKSVYQTESKLRAYVLPQLGGRLVAELKPADFEAWLKWALQRRRKVKKVPVLPVVALSQDDQNERQRRRKATMNRVIAALKGCLNYAYATHKVPSRDAWARLKKFNSVDSARLRWLSVEEATRLQNACTPSFRPLVRAALLTGCRAGELLALRAGDFDVSSKTLLIAESKSGKPRHVPLAPAGIALFDDLTAGRPSKDPVFARADGSPWYRVAIIRAMHEACAVANISPSATFHTLRHTFCSHLISRRVPLLFVASALGHRDARMVERHYGHLAPSQVAGLIREKLPSFGTLRKGKVRSLARARSNV
jgi:integrase